MSNPITENARISDVLLFEGGDQVNFVRDQITVVSGTLACAIGQVMGQITLGTATAAAKGGGNTGTGTLVMDATTPILANANKAGAGIYTVTCTVASTNAATFLVVDPNGVALGTCSFSGAGASVTFSDRLKFAITDGGTDFIVGDAFNITVTAGSLKWAQVNPAATDGSQAAAGVLIAGSFTSTLGADATAVAVTRGPAILKLNGLAWTSGMTGGQKTMALAQLQALGMTNRSDLGV